MCDLACGLVGDHFVIFIYFLFFPRTLDKYADLEEEDDFSADLMSVSKVKGKLEF